MSGVSVPLNYGLDGRRITAVQHLYTRQIRRYQVEVVRAARSLANQLRLDSRDTPLPPHPPIPPLPRLLDERQEPMAANLKLLVSPRGSAPLHPEMYEYGAYDAKEDAADALGYATWQVRSHPATKLPPWMDGGYWVKGGIMARDLWLVVPMEVYHRYSEPEVNEYGECAP